MQRDEAAAPADWRHSPEVEARTAALVASMSLAEKVELVTGDLTFNYGVYSAPIERVGSPALTMADGRSGHLTDLIGNLLDNSGKWARRRVRIAAARETGVDAAGRSYFTAIIDDDGPGLDPQAREAALQRGRRLDESRPGSGLGLSIVVDLAGVYSGTLRLEDSPLGGLRARLRLPAL